MKNVVICCDGTGNEISENISNVLKFYRCLRKTPKTEPFQAVFYDPGVGTLGRPDPWRKLKQDFIAILGLATGYGLDDNVLAAYEFLIRNYEEGDHIYLFGFSRGAYTVRVLAGLIHKIGLISPQQSNSQAQALRPTSSSPATGERTRRGRRRWRATTRAHHLRAATIRRRNLRASCRRVGQPSTSSGSGIRWRA